MPKPELIPIEPGDFVLMDSRMQIDSFVVMEVVTVFTKKVTVRPVRAAHLEVDDTDNTTRDRSKVQGVLGRDPAQALAVYHRLGWLSQERRASIDEAERTYRRAALALLNKDNT